jgi:glyoxylase-like metal-dependent hydrolase (beta-lactamase superfamily II)
VETPLIFGTTGLAGNGLYVAGLPWSPVYVLAAEQPVLFEAGFHAVGRIYERDIREFVPGKNPSILFLTHAHYDHCGAAAYLKKAFRGLIIAASPRAAEIAGRPNARKLMITLSRNVTGLIDSMEGIDRDMLLREPFEPFDVDHALQEGTTMVPEPGITVQVFATPGHTRDMFSYYIPERKILIATEASGIRDQMGYIVSQFLVDYDAYMASLRRLAELDVEVLCQGHHFVFVGRDVRSFFLRSIEGAERFKDRVEDLLRREGGSIPRVITIVKGEQYDTNACIKQPEAAYLLNLQTQIAHLADRLLRRSDP